MLWNRQVSRTRKKMEEALAFMSGEHRLVHHFVVRELHRVGKALPPEFIAEKLSLPLARVGALLDELEEHMTFLFRNDEGAVAWAYPVTVDKTPHHLTFSTGEQLYAA